MTTDQRLIRLKDELGYSIQKRKYYTLMKQFNIPTSRRNAKLPTTILDQYVLNKMSDVQDSERNWGVGRMMDTLVQKVLLFQGGWFVRSCFSTSLKGSVQSFLERRRFLGRSYAGQH